MTYKCRDEERLHLVGEGLNKTPRPQVKTYGDQDTIHDEETEVEEEEDRSYNMEPLDPVGYCADRKKLWPR